MKHRLYGAILGDLCGQPHEFKGNEGYGEPVSLYNPVSHITDDTIMTLATAYALINGVSFDHAYRMFGEKYIGDYYGAGFKKWLESPAGTIGNSWGNGCLMRISPIMYIKNKEIRNALLHASICTSHLHVDSIKACEELVNMYDGKRKKSSYPWIFKKFCVDSKTTIKFIWSLCKNCKTTKGAILVAVNCGGDTDTNASIAGELLNYINDDLIEADIRYVESKLDDFLLGVLREFNDKIDQINDNYSAKCCR